MPSDNIKGKKAEQVGAHFFKCENCGSMLVFDPSSQKLKCRHCNSLKDLVKVQDALDNPYTENSETGYEPWGDVKSIKCKSCGAEFVLNTYETSANCPYCNAPTVVDIDDVPGLKPNGILPFLVSEAKARVSFSEWAKGKWFAPFGFRKKIAALGAKGVYVPVFTYDTQTNSHYFIRYGVQHTRVVRRGKETHTETYIVWHTDSGSYSQYYNDVQVEASQYITENNLNKTMGFDTNNSKRYHAQFIAGFESERYSSGLDECWSVAKNIIDNDIRSGILSRYHYDVLDTLNVDTIYSSKKYKYVLAPIWTIAYKYKDKIYNAIVNGRNGEADGKYPKSPTKISGVVIFALAIVGLIIWLIYRYIGF